MEAKPKHVSYVIGPDGSPLTLANLPSPDARWIARRKAEIVVAVLGGILSLQEACERYTISGEEFMVWERTYSKLGLRGLRCAYLREHASSQSNASEDAR